MSFPLGERVSWQGHEGHVVASVDAFDAIRCERCAYIHVVPLPSAQDLDDYYQSTFYEESKPEYFESAERDREWLNVGFDMKLDMLDETIGQPRDGSDAPPRILDIGSGPGHFLLRAKERGWEAVGLEASSAAVGFSRNLGVEVHQGYFDGSPLHGLGRFDVIHMQHVLEHVLDPVALLCGLEGLLHPEGVLCIEVPNDFSVVQKILHTDLGYPAWWVAPPEHLNYFDKAALEALIARSGFAAINWSSQFPIDLALVAGFDYVRHPELGRSVHQSRIRLEKALSRADSGLLRKIYAALIEVGIGRELIVIARRYNQ